MTLPRKSLMRIALEYRVPVSSLAVRLFVNEIFYQYQNDNYTFLLILGIYDKNIHKRK